MSSNRNDERAASSSSEEELSFASPSTPSNVTNYYLNTSSYSSHKSRHINRTPEDIDRRRRSKTSAAPPSLKYIISDADRNTVSKAQTSKRSKSAGSSSQGPRTQFYSPSSSTSCSVNDSELVNEPSKAGAASSTQQTTLPGRRKKSQPKKLTALKPAIREIMRLQASTSKLIIKTFIK